MTGPTYDNSGIWSAVQRARGRAVSDRTIIRAIEGAEEPVTVVCPTCDGEGDVAVTVNGVPRGRETCATCDGEGRLEDVAPPAPIAPTSPPAMVPNPFDEAPADPAIRPCDVCDGTGTSPPGDNLNGPTCDVCAGTGQLRRVMPGDPEYATATPTAPSRPRYPTMPDRWLAVVDEIADLTQSEYLRTWAMVDRIAAILHPEADHRRPTDIVTALDVIEGWGPYPMMATARCTYCHGRGLVTVTDAGDVDRIASVGRVLCAECGGIGELSREAIDIIARRGFGDSRPTPTIDVDVPVPGVYRERAMLVAFLTRLYPSSIGIDATADVGFQTVVYIHGRPAGQMSWHIADADRDLFDHVTRDDAPVWDGHTTDEKYRRLAALPGSLTTDPTAIMASSLSVALAEDRAEARGVPYHMIVGAIDLLFRSGVPTDAPFDEHGDAITDAVGAIVRAAIRGVPVHLAIATLDGITRRPVSEHDAWTDAEWRRAIDAVSDAAFDNLNPEAIVRAIRFIATPGGSGDDPTPIVDTTGPEPGDVDPPAIDRRFEDQPFGRDDLPDVARYIREIASRMGLRDWQIVFRHDVATDDAGSEVAADASVTQNRRAIVIRFGPGWPGWTREEMRSTVVHELIHTWTERVKYPINGLGPMIGTILWTAVNDGVNDALEQLTDDISQGWAATLPLPGDPMVFDVESVTYDRYGTAIVDTGRFNDGGRVEVTDTGRLDTPAMFPEAT